MSFITISESIVRLKIDVEVEEAGPELPRQRARL